MVLLSLAGLAQSENTARKKKQYYQRIQPLEKEKKWEGD